MVSTFPWIVLGIPDTSHVGLLSALQEFLTDEGHGYLLNKIGYDVYGSTKDISSILVSLAKVNITNHIWLGAGITNCFPHFYNRLQKLITFRDGKCGRNDIIHPDGVYYWTIDDKRHIRGSLRRGVDGIVSNTPGTVLQVLREDTFRGNVRLATVKDNPWDCTAKR